MLITCMLLSSIIYLCNILVLKIKINLVKGQKNQNNKD
jgi:hypothetical protein